jgi:formylglycine-generating enzyme required for sulfatase activity
MARDGYERTFPVKTFAPNGYGLFDMSGNVRQWCSDWYQIDLARA